MKISIKNSYFPSFIIVILIDKQIETIQQAL